MSFSVFLSQFVPRHRRFYGTGDAKSLRGGAYLSESRDEWARARLSALPSFGAVFIFLVSSVITSGDIW